MFYFLLGAGVIALARRDQARHQWHTLGVLVSRGQEMNSGLTEKPYLKRHDDIVVMFRVFGLVVDD